MSRRDCDARELPQPSLYRSCSKTGTTCRLQRRSDAACGRRRIRWVGKLGYYLLRSLGLSRGHLVIDVGCRSGRLAQQLASDKSIRYVGTDVVPRLLESAKASTGRNDWEFHLVEGIRIPCPDNVADFVAFFSVLTHTTHEESFLYLQEAARCLKPGAGPSYRSWSFESRVTGKRLNCR